MREIDVQLKKEEFIKVFKQLLTDKVPVCLWQRTGLKSARKLYDCLLFKISKNPILISFIDKDEKKLEMKNGKVFAYCEEVGLLFRTQVVAIGDTRITLEAPARFYLLDENEKRLLKNNNFDEIRKIFVAQNKPESINSQLVGKKLLSEDERYKDVRESPRGKPRDGRKVTFMRKQDNKKVEMTCNLYDLSQGGIGFLSYDEGLFKRGDVLEILSFGEGKFKESLFGEVTSLSLHDFEAGLYKIGLKFVEKPQ